MTARIQSRPLLVAVRLAVALVILVGSWALMIVAALAVAALVQEVRTW